MSDADPARVLMVFVLVLGDMHVRARPPDWIGTAADGARLQVPHRKADLPERFKKLLVRDARLSGRLHASLSPVFWYPGAGQDPAHSMHGEPLFE